MRLKKLFAIVTLSTLLAACASLRAPAVANAPPAAPDTAAMAPLPMLTDASAAAASLPAVALDRDLMYRLLAAELAFQRNDWRDAYVTMLEAARQTRDPRIAHRAMEMAMAAKQAGEALVAIRLWRTLDPQSEEAMQYYLGFAVLNNQLDETRDIFALRLAQATPETRGVAMFQVQRFLGRAQDKAAVLALLDSLLAPYKDTLEAHLMLAQAAFANHDLVRANAEAQAALARAPDSELALLTQAQVTADPARAAELTADFLQHHPQANNVRNAYARMLIDQKQYTAARRQFEILLKQQPDKLMTLYALGGLCMEEGDNAAAERYFKMYLGLLGEQADDERDPGQVQAVLAQLAQQRGDSAAALNWLAQIEAADGHSALYLAAQIQRAQIIAKQGDVPGARKVLTDFHADDDAERVQLILAEAQILRDAGQAAQAYALLEAGKQRFPNDPDLLYDFAMAADSINDGEAMEAALRRVMALVPDNQHAYNALGYWLAEHNVRLPEALELIGKALQLAPDDPFIIDSMGWLQFRLGHLAEAENLLRRAYALRPDAEIAVHLGEVLWQRGQQLEAQTLWRAALAKDPKNEVLKNTLLRLNVTL
jgi:tetratricopeptide (TPR) repeat protein